MSLGLMDKYRAWRFYRSLSRIRESGFEPGCIIGDNKIEIRLLDPEDQSRNDGYIYDSSTYANGNVFFEGISNPLYIHSEHIENEDGEIVSIEGEPDVNIRLSDYVDFILELDHKKKLQENEPSSGLLDGMDNEQILYIMIGIGVALYAFIKILGAG